MKRKRAKKEKYEYELREAMKAISAGEKDLREGSTKSSKEFFSKLVKQGLKEYQKGECKTIKSLSDLD